MEQKNLDQVKEIAEELLNKLTVTASVEVSGEDGGIHLDIAGEDLGILIGFHGETLAALQLILSLALYKRLGKWNPVVVDVGGWRKRREEQLRKLAERMAERVKFTNEEQALPPMASFERRIIHLALSDNPNVTTQSRGEGRERRVVVKPRT